MSSIAWLGAGLLGAAFVEASQRRGTPVRVWNRTASRAQALARHGATPCATIGEAVVGAARVHLCLSEDSAVDAVLEALAPALAPGVPVVDHSTVSPAGARRRAAWLAERGIPFVQAPVFMAPANARAGTGLMLVAGPAETVAALRPALSEMTGGLLEYGDDAGRSALFKLFGNAMIVTLTAGLSDVYAIAENNGVTAEEARALFDRFAVTNAIGARGARMAARDFRPSFELAMARKDVGLMLDAAGDAVLAVLPAVFARMRALEAQGHGGEDLGVLARDSVATSERRS